MLLLMCYRVDCLWTFKRTLEKAITFIGVECKRFL
jgi:hypothetical protein